MGADITLRSVLDRQRIEHNVEGLREHIKALRGKHKTLTVLEITRQDLAQKQAEEKTEEASAEAEVGATASVEASAPERDEEGSLSDQELMLRRSAMTELEQCESEIVAAEQAVREADMKSKEGAYFRDSYNQSSLAWLCGLSYWNECREGAVVDGMLTIPAAIRWRELLAGADIAAIVLQATLNNQRNHACKQQAIAAGSTKELNYSDMLQPELSLRTAEDFTTAVQFFTSKRDAFVALLGRSIELNEPLEWNV